jgi:hypothetical protein
VSVQWDDANLVFSEVVETSIRRMMDVDLRIQIVWSLDVKVRSDLPMHDHGRGSLCSQVVKNSM